MAVPQTVKGCSPIQPPVPHSLTTLSLHSSPLTLRQPPSLVHFKDLLFTSLVSDFHSQTHQLCYDVIRCHLFSPLSNMKQCLMLLHLFLELCEKSWTPTLVTVHRNKACQLVGDHLVITRRVHLGDPTFFCPCAVLSYD